MSLFATTILIQKTRCLLGAHLLKCASLLVSHIQPRSEVRHLSMQCLPFRFNDLVRKNVRCCGHASSWASFHRASLRERERGGHSAAEAARVRPLRRGGKHVPTFERSKTTTAKTVGILGEVAEAARMPALQFRTSAADQADGPICRTKLLRCNKKSTGRRIVLLPRDVRYHSMCGHHSTSFRLSYCGCVVRRHFAAALLYRYSDRRSSVPVGSVILPEASYVTCVRA